MMRFDKLRVVGACFARPRAAEGRPYRVRTEGGAEREKWRADVGIGPYGVRTEGGAEREKRRADVGIGPYGVLAESGVGLI